MNAHTKIKAGKSETPFKKRATLKKPIHCFAIRLEALLRVAPFKSKDMLRYYLQGVFVHAHKREGAVCAATDGHRLGVRRDVDGVVAEPHIVAIPNGLKMPPRSTLCPWAVLTRTGDRFGHLSLVEGLYDREHDTAQNAIARVDECYQRFGDVIIDGTFPDYTRVIPKKSDDDTTRSFNGELFKSFGKALTIRGADNESPHIILDNQDGQFVGVLMPMRTKDVSEPDWLSGAEYPA